MRWLPGKYDDHYNASVSANMCDTHNIQMDVNTSIQTIGPKTAFDLGVWLITQSLKSQGKSVDKLSITIKD